MRVACTGIGSGQCAQDSARHVLLCESGGLPVDGRKSIIGMEAIRDTQQRFMRRMMYPAMKPDDDDGVRQLMRWAVGSTCYDRVLT